MQWISHQVTEIDLRKITKKAEKDLSSPQHPTGIIPLVGDNKIFTVLPYFPKLSDEMQRILKKT